MKKSNIYKLAMAAVIDNDGIEMEDKIEVLEVLMGDMKLARFSEEKSEDKCEEKCEEVEKNESV